MMWEESFLFFGAIANKTRKKFSEKPIVAFTNSTVFIQDLYMTNPVWSHGLPLNDLSIHTRLYKIYYWCLSHFSYNVQNHSGIVMFTYSIYEY